MFPEIVTRSPGETSAAVRVSPVGQDVSVSRGSHGGEGEVDADKVQRERALAVGTIGGRVRRTVVVVDPAAIRRCVQACSVPESQFRHGLPAATKTNARGLWRTSKRGRGGNVGRGEKPVLYAL